MKTAHALAAGFLGLLFLISGCGGDSGSTGSQPMNRQESADQGAARDADVAQPGQPNKPALPNKPAQQVKLVPDGRAIVYTANMTVRAQDVPVAADKAKGIIAGLGGIVADEKSNDGAGSRESSSTIVFKVPPDKYNGVIAQFGKELGKRESLQQSAEDVTEQVADVEARLKSAQASLNQLRSLLSKANTIGEVLSVEKEISSRQAELEALQARQKSLQQQTSMATITLQLVGPTAPIVEEEPPGFLAGLKAGWNALVLATQVGLTILGALLPWLIVIVILWFAARFAWRRIPRRPKAPRPPAAYGPYGPPVGPPPVPTGAAATAPGQSAPPPRPSPPTP